MIVELLVNWQHSVSVLYVLIIFKFVRTHFSVAGKHESALQKAEHTQQRTERQKLKAMKKIIPESDDEENKELYERPNTTVDMQTSSL